MTTFTSFQQNSLKPTDSATQPGFLQKYITDPIKNAFSGGINQIQQGAAQIGSGQGNPLITGTEGALKVGAGIVGAVASPLAPIINPTIGAGVNTVGNAIGSIPAVQQFATSPAGQTTSRVAEDLSNAGTIAGGILGAKGGVEVGGNIWDRANSFVGNKGVVNATSNLDTAVQTGVKAQQSIDTSVGKYSSDLGTNFKAGAAEIEKSNPGKTLNLTTDQVDALNKLKDNKSFSLPDYLKMGSKKGVGYTPENLSQIENLYKLTPTQAQDLITQLNKSTFTEKASGLGVDQTKIGLTNEIKDAAKQAFGDQWTKVYSDYAKGQTAIDRISDVFNRGKDVTASDFNKTMGTIKKLSSDPQGKVILQNSINDFKNQSGIDLTNPSQAISKIVEAEQALDKAQKPGFVKQILNPTYLARSLVRYLIIYQGIKAVTGAVQGK